MISVPKPWRREPLDQRFVTLADDRRERQAVVRNTAGERLWFAEDQALVDGQWQVTGRQFYGRSRLFDPQTAAVHEAFTAALQQIKSITATIRKRR